MTVFEVSVSRCRRRPDLESSKAAAKAYCQFLYNSRDSQGSTRVDPESRGEFKCRRRSGILLHESYVSDVCSCLEHRDCVFYEGE